MDLTIHNLFQFMITMLIKIIILFYSLLARDIPILEVTSWYK